MSEPPVRKVFLSYCWDDREIVEQVHAALESWNKKGHHGFEFWRDKVAPMRDRQNRWQEDTLHAFHASQIVVFFVSKSSLDPKRYAHHELVQALLHAKFVIPVLLEPVDNYRESYASRFKALPVNDKYASDANDNKEYPRKQWVKDVVSGFHERLPDDRAMEDFRKARRELRIKRLCALLNRTKWNDYVLAHMRQTQPDIGMDEAAAAMVDGGLREALEILRGADRLWCGAELLVRPPDAVEAIVSELAHLAVDAEGRVYATCLDPERPREYDVRYESLMFVEIGIASLAGRTARFRLHPQPGNNDWVGERYLHIAFHDAGVDLSRTGESWDTATALRNQLSLQAHSGRDLEKRARGKFIAAEDHPGGPYYVAVKKHDSSRSASASAGIESVRKLFPSLRIVEYLDEAEEYAGPDEWTCHSVLDDLLHHRKPNRFPEESR